MFIARQIRKENVAEYILYIWQLEDLLRACRFDPDKIYATLLEGNDSLDDAQKREALEWYLDLATLMREEDKAQIGHIDHTLHLINDLNDLHLRLLKLPVGEEYRAVFAPLSGELPKIKKAIESRQDITDIEACFRALYSVKLLPMKQIDKKEYINDVMELISPVIARLAAIYGQVERGEIDLYKGVDGDQSGF